MSRNNRHVVPTSDGRWAVRREGSSRASGVFDTQREAEGRARQMERNTGGGEVVTHREDGRIRDSDTVPPARDPFPPRDKK
jgi:uncharacterized protein DUF2188